MILSIFVSVGLAQAQGEPCPPGQLCNPLGTANFAQLVDRIVTFMLQVAVPIAVIMAVWSAFLFMTAGGSEQRVGLAKRALTYTVIGILVLALSKGLTSIIASFFG